MIKAKHSIVIKDSFAHRQQRGAEFIAITLLVCCLFIDVAN